MSIRPKQVALRLLDRHPFYRVLPPSGLRTYAALRYHGERSTAEVTARLVTQLGAIPTRHLTTAVVAARAAFRSGHDDLVEDALGTLQQRFPEAPAVHELRCDLQTFYGSYHDALRSARRAQLLKPSSAGAASRVVRLTYRVLPRSEADQEAASTVTRFPRNAGVLWAVARECDRPEQYERLKHAWDSRVTDEADLLYGVRQLSMAAARAGQVEAAADLYRRAIRLMHAGARLPRKVTETRLEGRGAWRAIEDLCRALDDAAVPFFFAAGTALGLVREGRPLSADGDIDVGIFESDFDYDALVGLFTKNPHFDLSLNPNSRKVALRHRGGSPVDVFRFYQENGRVWHDGVFVRWHNTPFPVERRQFQGIKLPVPANSGGYLTENYGDWQTPNPAFDAFTHDAPNVETTWPAYARLHYLRRAFKRLADGDGRGAVPELRHAGEDELVASIEGQP